LSFSASAETADTIFSLALAFNILLLFSLSAELADTPARELFGIPPDTLFDLTFVYPLSITGQIDFLKLGEHLPSDSSVLIFASIITP